MKTASETRHLQNVMRLPNKFKVEEEVIDSGECDSDEFDENQPLKSPVDKNTGKSRNKPNLTQNLSGINDISGISALAKSFNQARTFSPRTLLF